MRPPRRAPAPRRPAAAATLPPPAAPDPPRPRAAPSADAPDVAPPASADAPHFQAMPVVGAPSAAPAAPDRRRRQRREPRPALLHVARRRAHGGRARARHHADRRHRPRRPRDQEGRRGAPRRRRRPQLRAPAAPATPAAPRRAATPAPAAAVQAPTGATPAGAAPRRRRRRGRRAHVDDPQGHRAQPARVGRQRGARLDVLRGRHDALLVGARGGQQGADGRPTASRPRSCRSSCAPRSRRSSTGRGSTPSCAATDIVVKRHVNLGVAVSINDGKDLVVPVIHNAEELNLLGLTRALTDLAERGRTKQLTADEMSGGTFSLTNPGGFGTLLRHADHPAAAGRDPGRERDRQAPRGRHRRARQRLDRDPADHAAGAQLRPPPGRRRLRAQFLALVKQHLETWGAAEYGV